MILAFTAKLSNQAAGGGMDGRLMTIVFAGDGDGRVESGNHVSPHSPHSPTKTAKTVSWPPNTSSEYITRNNPHLTHDPITRPDTPTARRDDEHDG